jgi:hypothetical protein
MKKSLKLKINPIRKYLGLIIYPIKPSAGLFILIKPCETIPLNRASTCDPTALLPSMQHNGQSMPVSFSLYS